MSGLEPLGIPGPDHLRERLTNCSDPLAEIAEFQVGHNINNRAVTVSVNVIDDDNVDRRRRRK